MESYDRKDFCEVINWRVHNKTQKRVAIFTFSPDIYGIYSPKVNIFAC